MDPIVLAAMAKWPNVPALFGWLRLDARGRWCLRGEVLTQAAMAAFFARNYAVDEAGRYYVQNGPQRVYVALEVAPYVARREAQGWRLVPGGISAQARSAWLTPEGALLLDADGVLALVDDRDLAQVAALVLSQWDGNLTRLPPALVFPEGTIPFGTATLENLLRRFACVAVPAA